MDLNSIPSTVYVMLGSLIIALISSLSAYVTIIYTKENKISEFRHEWANELRNESSSLISKLTELSFINSVLNKEGVLELVDDKYGMITKNISVKSEIKELSSKVILRLNPDRVSEATSVEGMINELLVEINELLTTKSTDENHVVGSEKNIEINEKIEILEGYLSTLIKENWQVVKSGEDSYVLAKNLTGWFTIAMVLIIFAAIITLIFSGGNADSKKLQDTKQSSISISISICQLQQLNKFNN